MQIDTDLFTSGSQAQGSEGDLQQQNVAIRWREMQDDPDPYALPSVPSDLAKDKEVITGVFAEAHKAGLRPLPLLDRTLHSFPGNLPVGV